MSGLPEDHIPSLDGLRAGSIGLVFASHAGYDHVVPGGLGVTVFFFISGFLITTLLFREILRYGSVSYAAFYARRALRLMPPLLVVLLTGMLLVGTGILTGRIDTPTVISQIFFVFNYFDVYGPARPIPGQEVFWSLSVEEHFYLIWPAVFTLLLAMSRGANGVFVILLLLFPIWRAVRWYLFGDTPGELYYLSDVRLDSLLYGCWLAVLMARGRIPAAADRKDVRLAALGLSLLVLAFTIAYRDEGFRNVWRYSLQGIALMPIFYYAVTSPKWWAFRPLNWSAVRMVGVLSYTIYLIHFTLIELVEQHTGLYDGGPRVLLAAILLSLGYAAAVHWLVERPSARLRRRVTGHRAKVAPLPVG